MSWANNYLVSRNEILAHPGDFTILPGETLAADDYIVSNLEARQKICLVIASLPSDTTEVPIFQEYVPCTTTTTTTSTSTTTTTTIAYTEYCMGVSTDHGGFCGAACSDWLNSCPQ